MTSRYAAWLTPQYSDYFNAKDRAYTVANIIADKPTTITVNSRLSGALPGAQVVRLDMLASPVESDYGASMAVVATQKLLILGYKNHPGIDDTDLQEGDQFLADGNNYVVQKVENQFSDRLLATAEARDG